MNFRILCIPFRILCITFRILCINFRILCINFRISCVLIPKSYMRGYGRSYNLHAWKQCTGRQYHHQPCQLVQQAVPHVAGGAGHLGAHGDGLLGVAEGEVSSLGRHPAGDKVHSPLQVVVADVVVKHDICTDHLAAL